MRKVHTNHIYLDSASTTRIHDEIIRDANTLMKEYYGNADSLHRLGQRVSTLVKDAREAIAKMLNVLEHEVIFTSGGSESNASAIKGIALSDMSKKHIITSKIEHASVLETIDQLKRLFNYEVTYLDVNKEGIVEMDDLKNSLREDTILVSLMHMNNELGSISPINEYAEIIKKNSNAYFHVDGVQAFSKVPLDLKRIDAYSISAHKLGGLKGSGLLVKKANVPFEPLIPAGQQEFGLRGGTLDTISAITLAKAMRLSLEDNKQNYDKIVKLNAFLKEKLKDVNGITINSSEKASPYILNLSVKNVGSEIMMNALNKNNIYVSAKSTCHSQKDEVSHVLEAIGLNDELALSAIRISLSSENTIEELEKCVKIILETKNYVQH